MNGLVVLILILLILGIVGAPNWGLHNYGYYPSGTIGVVVLILIILLLLNRI